MRRLAIAFAVLGTILLVAGCNSEGTVKPVANQVIGTLPKAEAVPTAPASKLTGDPQAGSKVFASAGCTGCHTLAAAHSTGTVGPNLDQAHPTYKLATARVTFGKGAMPSFKGQLSDQQIADVASYVVKSTGGKPPGSTGP